MASLCNLWLGVNFLILFQIDLILILMKYIDNNHLVLISGRDYLYFTIQCSTSKCVNNLFSSTSNIFNIIKVIIFKTRCCETYIIFFKCLLFHSFFFFWTKSVIMSRGKEFSLNLLITKFKDFKTLVCSFPTFFNCFF